MATYLDLVNKVIAESQSEQDALTSGTWATAEAGRRIYPRIKRNVADAWKLIQMSRNEWEFNTGSFSDLLYPRVKVTNGLRAAGTPPVGSVFVGADSDFSLTVRAVYTTGDWTAGTAVGQIEFEDHEGTRLMPGEEFVETSPVADDGAFIYLGKGSYDFLEIDSSIREPQWGTFFASYTEGTPYPIRYIPWDNWVYNEYTFATNSVNGPAYLSQDFEGKVVFYPQTLNPFRVNFIYNAAPQILVDYDDEVERLPEEYHDWIAWRALMLYAMSEKNPTLFAYGKENETFYRLRAERNLMPLVSRAPSKFNE